MAFDFSNKVYYGIVEDNIDPKRKGRIKVRVQSIFDDLKVDEIPFAAPYKELNGESFGVPAIGRIVNVIFENNQLYSPKYIYTEHYNSNLQNRLAIMGSDEYSNFRSLIFNHTTQVYTDNKNLTIDHKFNKLTIDNERINLELKDNLQTLNLGSNECDQDAVLGTNFFEWFDKFITEFVNPVSIIGNLGAPVIKTNLDKLLNEYLTLSKQMKFRSKNVKIIDNNKVKLLKRLIEPDPNLSDITSSNSNFVSKETNDNVNKQKEKEKEKVDESKPTRLVKIGEADYHDNNIEYVSTIKDENGNTGNTFIVDDNGDILGIDQEDVTKYTNGNDAYADSKKQSTSEENIIEDDNYGSYVPINEDDNYTNNQNVSTKVNDTSSISVETQPSKGKVKIYKSGKSNGEKDYVVYKGKQIVKEFYEPLMKMIKAAEKDGVTLILNDAYRNFQSQKEVRSKNKTKPFTDKELETNASTLYNPITSPPGFGMHITGNAVDFATANGTNAAYRWLAKNAFIYGFVRTVKSEYWHWEYKPWEYDLGSARPKNKNTQFAFVPKDHATWNDFA
jgi:LAS superfamily LD-carboxypeptidase LdcB